MTVSFLDVLLIGFMISVIAITLHYDNCLCWKRHSVSGFALLDYMDDQECSIVTMMGFLYIVWFSYLEISSSLIHLLLPKKHVVPYFFGAQLKQGFHNKTGTLFKVETNKK